MLVCVGMLFMIFVSIDIQCAECNKITIKHTY